MNDLTLYLSNETQPARCKWTASTTGLLDAHSDNDDIPDDTYADDENRSIIIWQQVLPHELKHHPSPTEINTSVASSPHYIGNVPAM
jgi:hypothetical protein